MGLHVHVLRAEELFRPLDGDDLDLVYLLAAAVVALAWIALGVLVRKDGALRSQNRGIHDLGVRSDHALPPLRVREMPGVAPGRMVVERYFGASIPASSLNRS